MRSQKQVRHVRKVRCLKNAAAGKWKTYRKRLEAIKAWQNNAILTRRQHFSHTLAPPSPMPRKIKEPKQRSPEELAERQRFREQRRLEKKLAKQRASTSTLPEIREKKLKNVSGNGSPKKASATKSTKTKNSTIEGTTKPKQVQRAVNVAKQEITAKKVNEPKVTKVSKSENGSKSKHQYVKDEKLVLTKEKRSQLPSPAKLEQKTEKIEQKKLVQSKETANENEQVHANTGKAKGISKGQTKEKRRQQSDPDSLLPERDFVEGNAHEMASKKAKDDFTERVRLQQKKKGRYRDEQQSKSVESAEEFTDKTTVYDGKNQSCTLESIGFKTGEMVDQVTPSSNEIPKDSEILLKTEMIRKAPVPEELGTNAARLAEKHLEPLGITGLRGGNVIKNMTMKTPANEAKDEANVEKKEPFIVVPQTDGVSRVTPTRERICKLLPRDIQFCVHMIEKHGDDYEAMAKDQSNTFRDSAKGIARKIRIFKESPQYETYLKQKSEKNDPVA